MMGRVQRVKARDQATRAIDCHRAATALEKTPGGLWKRHGRHADALLTSANHESEPAAVRHRIHVTSNSPHLTEA